MCNRFRHSNTFPCSGITGGVQLEGGALFFNPSAVVALKKRLCGRLWYLQSEMGVYRDNLWVKVIGDNFLPIIVIAQNGFDLSITDIAFVIYFVIADKLSR